MASGGDGELKILLCIAIHVSGYSYLALATVTMTRLHIASYHMSMVSEFCLLTTPYSQGSIHSGSK